MSSRRPYANADLIRLLAAAFLYHNGWTTARVAALPPQQIETEAELIQPTANNRRSFSLRLLTASLSLNEAVFTHLLTNVEAAIGFEKTITDVCHPYLARVGTAWRGAKLIPLQERFAGHLIRSRIMTNTEALAPEQTGSPTFVLFSPQPGDDMPLLFINYLLRKAGRSVLYLGNDKPSELQRAAALPSVKFLYVHFSGAYAGVRVDDYFESLRKTYPGKTIVASGEAVAQSQRHFVNFIPLRSDAAVQAFAKESVTLLEKHRPLHPLS